ncbi:hypothetical protein LTR95_012828 [Oleoguttula sp. CCFEE 5521]
MAEIAPSKRPRRRRQKSRRISISTAVLQSPLFKLSGEMRNIIWRLAVVGKDPVVYSDAGVEEPGILLTCRAIRNEVASIFYLENNVNRLTLLGLTCTDMRTKDPIHVGTPSWSNALRGLKAIFTRELLMRPIITAVDSAESSAIDNLFATVTKLREHDVPWSVVAELLEMQHRTMDLIWPGWDDEPEVDG